MHDTTSLTPPHRIDPRIEVLVDAYIDSSIDDDQFQTLCDWLRSDAEHRRAFARKLALHSEIAEWCIERSGGDLAGSLDTAEAGAELPMIHIDASTPLPKKAYASALSYVIEHTFTPRRVAMLASAAALLLGMVLAIVLLGGPDKPEPIVKLPDQPAPVVDLPASHRVVATLTAEHDAAWDRRPGEDLYAGQHFTLTEGMAEIMTNAGAVVMIEGPAKIEFVDDDNALVLHEGRLVGWCDTDSSKGLLIHTSHAEITDIGTVFGVEAGPGRTLATVFKGEIEFAALADDQAVSLAEGQTARLTVTDGEAHTTVERRLARGFESLHPVPQTPAERWRDYEQALARDADLLAYYSFEAGTLVNGKAVNQAVQTRARLDATFGRTTASARPTAVAGRFDGATALYFDRDHNRSTQHDQVLVVPDWEDVSADLDALTVAAWVRMDDTTGWHVIATQWSDDGAPHDRYTFHLGVRCPDYKILDVGLHDNGAEVFKPTEVPGPTVQLHVSGDGTGYRYDMNNAWRTQRAPLEKDRWYLVACTIDARAGVSKLFIDGRLVDTSHMRFAGGLLPSLSQPLVIGGKVSMHEDVGMHGAIDDVVLLSRVLSSDEIQAMYQAGVPE